MYAYLNEISMLLPKNESQETWPLLYEVMEISSEIKNEYSIESIKVPNDFQSLKIANSHSIKELLSLPDEEFDNLNKQLIYDFLGNRTLSEIDEIELEIINEIDKHNTWIEVKYIESSSQLLTGAHLLKMPIISFQTSDDFKVDFLPCEYSVEYVDKTQTRNIKVQNIYCVTQLSNHHASLIGIKRDVIFGKEKWNPYTNPIWNDKTKKLLEEMQFPQSVNNKKDKISELKEVGEKIAVLNSWRFDSKITSINSNSGQIRMVFISESAHKPAYISIDVKNAYGRFEHHDNRGRHLGEIDFETGNYIPRNNSLTGKDTTGNHDLKMNR